MIPRNLRHLRVFLAVAETGSVTRAADRCFVSQPAVTQALTKLERAAGGALFDRTRQGFFPNKRGEMLARRVRRAFARLDPALEDVSPRLLVTATEAQLQALVAVREAENFTLAARRLGLAQPSVHRAVSQLEREAARALFERTSFGIVATRPARALAEAARLAGVELDQAEAELAEIDGGEGGRIVIGALPLSRSVILPAALTAFRARRPRAPVTVIDGRYDELLGGLRRGEVDIIVGALREPAPIGDVVQEPLFDDRLLIIAGRDHELAGRTALSATDLREWPWVVPRSGTPARTQFDAFFAVAGPPERIIEAGSILLMREILSKGDHLGCISAAQAGAEIGLGLLRALDVAACWSGRPIGLTTRAAWEPTPAQALMRALIREAATRLAEHRAETIDPAARLDDL